MLLDTNVYSALAKGDKSATQVIKDEVEVILPLPVIAELRYGFLKGSKSEYNERVLQQFMEQERVSIVVPTLKTTNYFAQLRLYCTLRGRSLSHNDIWIAALARENDYSLITFDRDFKVLSDIF